MSLTRRQFLKRTGLAALVLALGRLIATPEPEPNPLLKQAWDGCIGPIEVRDECIGVIASGEHIGQTTWASTGSNGGMWIQPDGLGAEQYFLKCHTIWEPSG